MRLPFHSGGVKKAQVEGRICIEACPDPAIHGPDPDPHPRQLVNRQSVIRSRQALDLSLGQEDTNGRWDLYSAADPDPVICQDLDLTARWLVYR